MESSDMDGDPEPQILISDTAAHNSGQGFANPKITDTFEITQTNTDMGYCKSINGEWVFGFEIGEGSFSKTRLITREADDRQDALKVYNKISLETQRKLIYETMEWSNNLVKVQEEIDIWTRLNSPWIPQIYEIFEKQSWHKLYVRNELGDLGVPGNFDYDERTFALKKSIYTLYTNKILSEQEALRKNFKSIEHPSTLNVTQVPDTHFNPYLKISAIPKPFLNNNRPVSVQSLDSISEGGKLKLQFIVGRIFFDMCLGVYYLHNLGIGNQFFCPAKISSPSGCKNLQFRGQI
jgi:serine/threonine protein kinase